MPEQNSAMHQCPFCKEEVKVDAIRCKHCQAMIPAEKPSHQGVCPFCKEKINPEATRCMHCKADFAPTLLIRSRVEQRRRDRFPQRLARNIPGCEDCDPGTIEIVNGQAVVYDLTSCDANWCYYATTSPPGGIV
jgi:hypothetical protein